MSTQALHVPAGKLFCLSSGEYSDYGYNGHFLALIEITPEMFRNVEAECKKAERKKKEEDEFAYGKAIDAFMPALIKRGWVIDIDCVEIHIGAYGELELS